ncbi:hypothetical protein [Mycolicibacterium vaccae]|uniref:hypothetical protein n=1 Tax=Mycolicibacterium vaccae TaxID=1810 RepID=UPI003D043A74
MNSHRIAVLALSAAATGAVVGLAPGAQAQEPVRANPPDPVLGPAGPIGVGGVVGPVGPGPVGPGPLGPGPR